MLEAFSTPRNKTRTLLILVVCAVLAIAALAIGVSDNPPGILCAFGAAAALVLAFVHPWRKPRQFIRLAIASVVGLVVFGILHNVFEVFAERMASSSLLHGFLAGIGVTSFLIAVLLCPPGLVVGVIGALVTLVTTRRRSRPDPAAAT